MSEREGGEAARPCRDEVAVSKPPQQSLPVAAPTLAASPTDVEPVLSRTGSTNSAGSELNRTLDHLNLNAPPVLPRGISQSQPFRPPAAVAWLVGTWKGKGKGIFPTIRDFEYMEECSFEWDHTNPRPLLFYRQQTFSTKGYPPKPMHSESGHVRVISAAGAPSSRIEYIVSAPNGVCTVEEGTVEGHCIRLKLTSTVRSSTARPPYVTGLERTFTVDPTAVPPTLHYVIDMATTKTPTLTRHLEAYLTKWTDDHASDDLSDGDDSCAPSSSFPQPQR